MQLNAVAMDRLRLRRRLTRFLARTEMLQTRLAVGHQLAPECGAIVLLCFIKTRPASRTANMSDILATRQARSRDCTASGELCALAASKAVVRRSGVCLEKALLAIRMWSLVAGLVRPPAPQPGYIAHQAMRVSGGPPDTLRQRLAVGAGLCTRSAAPSGFCDLLSATFRHRWGPRLECQADDPCRPAASGDGGSIALHILPT